MTPKFEKSPDLVHTVRSVDAAGAALHVESLEDPSIPVDEQRTILLLSEAEAPSSRWSAALLTGLARIYGRCAWFDTRDVGGSTWVAEPFGMTDLVDDVVAVIDALEASAVDLFGRSMGGEVAMRVAIARPDLVRSLVLLSSTPGRREELGFPQGWLIDKMSERLLGSPPADAEAQAVWLVEQWEWFNGPVFDFDRDLALAMAREEVAAGWRGSNGHGVAVMEADDIVDELRQLSVPTTILHGTADPVLPVDHARALHALIEGSQLSLIEGLGHELPDGFVAKLLELVAQSYARS